MTKLDKSKSYGAIMGDTEGRAFEQDGKFFGSDEMEIVSDAPADKPKAKKAAVVTDAPADPAVDAQLAAQLGDA